MIADFDFYQTVYGGRKIKTATDYAFFGERASDELALYRKIGQDCLSLKKCACAVADILFEEDASQKNGKQILSENLAGYYSASYGTVSGDEFKKRIQKAISTYLDFQAIKIVY